MKSKYVVSSKLVVLLGFCAIACSTPKPEIVYASTAEHSGYAMAYPARLQALIDTWNARVKESQDNLAEIPTFPGRLANADPKVAVAVIERADEEGRGKAYAEAAQGDTAVRTFFDEEREGISRRVSGAADAASKKQTCEMCKIEIDFYGSVSYALKDSVNKALDERMETRSEAWMLIDRNRTALGKKNAAALEEESVRISRMSYIVHIELVAMKLEMSRLLAEAGDVEDTLDDVITEEKASAAKEGRAKQEKQASEARIKALEQSRSGLDAVVANAKKLSTSMPARIDSLRKDYEKTLDNLTDSFEEMH